MKFISVTRIRGLYRDGESYASDYFKGLDMLNIKPATIDKFVRVVPELEAEIGEKPAKMLLQLEYWIRASNTEKINGKDWTYQSTVDMKLKAFGGWSLSTINRVIKKLETLQLIEIDNFNKAKYDHTRWFCLNPVGIGKLKSIFLFEGDLRSNQNDVRSNQNELRSNQNDVRSNQNELRSTQNEPTIPESPTENPSESPALNPPAAATREDAAAAVKSNLATPEKALIEEPMPPVKVETVVKADDIQEGHTRPVNPFPPVPPPPPSHDWKVQADCPEESPADLKLFFNACRAGELEIMIQQYGADRIRSVIEAVKLLPNVDNPPGLVRTKLRLGALGVWKWPTQSTEGKSYITGKYAEFIEH